MTSESPSISKEWAADAPGGLSPPAVIFRLDGPTRQLDPRLNAYRRDVADVALAGTLFAPHYSAPMLRNATAAVMMHNAPSDQAEAVSQLLPGEHFAVLDIVGGWAWGYSAHDHYVGYVAEDALALPSAAAPTHRVTAREALIFSAPSIKAPMTGTLPLGARIAGMIEDGFLSTDAGFLHQRHVAPIGEHAGDAVTVAEQFIGMPYLWGGRGVDGIDCSGLVQVALAAIGVDAPRDTDMQREAVGTPLAEEARLRRGDIISFPGHVGLMADETSLIHANAHWMSVVVEPLADVVARLKPHHDRPILGRRRL